VSANVERVLIERMRWWHLPDVHEIELTLFPSDAWSVEQFWQELAQSSRYYLVARDESGIVGYGGVLALPPDADVQTLGVRPDRQGSGIASRLLAALLAEAVGRGATHVMLEVRGDNAAAVALYERFGFARITQRRRYYPDGADAMIMRRDLRSPVTP
jgi:[ribosomal protein S18]-alanine N-acetyltransferase